MDQQGQKNSKTNQAEQNMKDLEDLAKELQGNAKESIEKSISLLKKLRSNMDVETALKMKSQLEEQGHSFEHLNSELGKFRKMASQWGS